jgi:hypothetical protein
MPNWKLKLEIGNIRPRASRDARPYQRELRDEEVASGTCTTRMTRRTFDFQEGMYLGLRGGNLLGVIRLFSVARLLKGNFK